MTNIRELSGSTGFSRDAIRLRVKRYNLPEEFDAKDVIQLRPLDEKHAKKISLEEARTEETIESTELKRIQRQKLEGELAPVVELRDINARLLERISTIIRASPLDSTRKQDIFGLISDEIDAWEKE